MSKQPVGGKVEVSVGFAADAGGSGLAYAAMHAGERKALLRVPFQVRRSASGQGREVGYGALRAVAAAVRERHAEAVTFVVADESLTVDLDERRVLPTSLTIPYVALRCALNRFVSAAVRCERSAEVGDLAARALAEVSLNVAA